LFPITWFSVTLQWFACRYGWTSTSKEVQSIFQSESLPPKWCLIGNNFGDALYFSINMFTTHVIPSEAQALGSSNWAIPIFFVQSNLVYIIAIALAFIPTRQWVLLAFLIGWFYYFESFAYPFLIGLAMALADVKGIWKGWQKSPLAAQIGFGLLCLSLIAASLWIPFTSDLINGQIQSIHAPNATWALSAIPYRLIDTLYLGNIIAAFAVCMFCEVNLPTQAFLKTPILQWLGDHSVAIYLTHELVLQTIMYPIVLAIYESYPATDYSLLVLISFSIALPFVLLVAYVTEVLVSTPSMYFANVYFD
jgi:peptidoglycan/LPS O-acetylase OafA/YrhL